MLNRIKQLLTGSSTPKELPKSDLPLAAAALLVEAAVMDGQFDDDERTVVLNLLEDRFELNGQEAEDLLEEAEAAIAESNELYTLTRIVKDRFDESQRIELIEMLWEVAYADGEVHDYEANLIRRLSGLLYVTDRASGEARKRVAERLTTQK